MSDPLSKFWLQPWFAARLAAHDVARSAGLLFRRGPSAISRLVIAVRVLSVERAPGRAWPHVRKECGEAVAPTAAHRNAACAVDSVFGVGLAKAAALRVVPRPIFAGSVRVSARPARMPMGYRPHTSEIGSQTAATPSAPVKQRVCNYCGRSAAVARALPNDAPARSVCSALNNQSAKALPGQVPEFHGLSYPTVGIPRNEL